MDMHECIGDYSNLELKIITEAKPDILIDHLREATIFDADRVAGLLHFAIVSAEAELEDRETARSKTLNS